MFLLIRYNDGPGMLTAAGVVGYFEGHLQKTQEAGGLAGCVGYLSRNGQVKAVVFNADLWLLVGWDPEKDELPPPELLERLCTGHDLYKNKLTRGRGWFRQPKEVLITLPAEVSQSLKDHPEIARELLQAAVAAHLAEVEREAVPVRIGGGKKEWRHARTLTLAYFHAENRGGEVHYHAHVLTFIPAMAADGWRSWDNVWNVRRLSEVGGSREKATDAMLELAKWHGLEIVLRRGVAAEAPGQVQGATVKGLDGQIIEAGSLDRRRRVEILAAQELKRELGGDVAPLTPRELEIVRKLSGARAVWEMSGERRRHALAEKLNKLGMLGKDGCILPKAELVERLKAYEEKLALAQVQLEAGGSFPGTGQKHLAAASLIQTTREHVASVAGSGVDLAGSTKAARIRWTEDYARVLLLVHQAGPGGLRTDSLNQRDRNLLSKLKGAGHLTGRKIHGRQVYRVSDFGISKLQELRLERGSLVDSLLPGIRAELQLAADSGPGAAGGRGKGTGETAGGVGLSFGAGVHRGSDQPAGERGIQAEASGMERSGSGREHPVPDRGAGVGVEGGADRPAVGSEPNTRVGALRLAASGATGVDPGEGVREPGHAIPENPTCSDHGQELAGTGGQVAGNPDAGGVLEALRHGGLAGDVPARGLHSPAGDIDAGGPGRGFPALPEPARTRSARPGEVSLGREGRKARSGGPGSADIRPARRGDRGFGRSHRTGNTTDHPMARRPRRAGREGERVGFRPAGARDPRAIRGLGALDLRSVHVAALVCRPGVSVARRGQPVLARGSRSMGRGVSVAAPAGGGLGEPRSGMAAEAVRRSARLALDLMDPRNLLDPLRGLDLPHNLVWRGIEKAWGFGLRIGHATGRRLRQDFGFLAQIPAAVLRPVKAAIQVVVQRTNLVEVAARQLREEECRDPEDLREMVAMRMDLIREVFSEEEEPLDGLHPVRDALDLPCGHLYTLPFAQATREAFQAAVHDLDDACRESGREVYGQSFERSTQSVFMAETLFRAGYGLKPIGRQELEREWPERLSRLVREAWHRILERSVDVGDRAQRVHDLRAEAVWYEEMQAKPRSIVNWDLPSSVPLSPSHGLGKEGTLPEFENNSERFGATSFTSR